MQFSSIMFLHYFALPKTLTFSYALYGIIYFMVIKIMGPDTIPNTQAPISKQLNTFSFFYVCCFVYLALFLSSLVFKSTKAI